MVLVNPTYIPKNIYGFGQPYILFLLSCSSPVRPLKTNVCTRFAG